MANDALQQAARSSPLDRRAISRRSRVVAGYIAVSIFAYTSIFAVVRSSSAAGSSAFVAYRFNDVQRACWRSIQTLFHGVRPPPVKRPSGSYVAMPLSYLTVLIKVHGLSERNRLARSTMTDLSVASPKREDGTDGCSTSTSTARAPAHSTA
jgi:hypothetical protein